MIRARIKSRNPRNVAITTAKLSTMIVLSVTCSRVGQFTLRASAFTSRKNVPMFETGFSMILKNGLSYGHLPERVPERRHAVNIKLVGLA